MADPLPAPWVLAALFNHRAVVDGAAGGTVFVFPGYGWQWTDMAAELLGSAPVFADVMARCDAAFSEFLDWSLLDAVLGGAGPSPPRGAHFTQPVSFAVMVSLAAQWMALEIRPDAVLGHSHGEVAAAYVAGGLSLRDAAKVVAQRSIGLSAIAGSGDIVSVPLPVDRVLAVIERSHSPISVTAHNGPSSTVVTGPPAAVEDLMAELERNGVSALRLPVDYPADCGQIDELLPALRTSLSDLAPRRAEISFVSSVTGAGLDTSILDGDYWFANLRQTVLFEQAVRWVCEHGYRTFIETSPTPVLVECIRESVDQYSAVREKRGGSHTPESSAVISGESGS